MVEFVKNHYTTKQICSWWCLSFDFCPIPETSHPQAPNLPPHPVTWVSSAKRVRTEATCFSKSFAEISTFGTEKIQKIHLELQTTYGMETFRIHGSGISIYMNGWCLWKTSRPGKYPKNQFFLKMDAWQFCEFVTLFGNFRDPKSIANRDLQIGDKKNWITQHWHMIFFGWDGDLQLAERE